MCVIDEACSVQNSRASGQDVPSVVANQNAGFASSCPLADSAILNKRISKFKHKTCIKASDWVELT